MSTASDFMHPDLCWVRRAMLSALLTHPIIRNAEVFYPTTPQQAKRKVPIVRGRLFGGPELIEPGLTLAVYPYHTGYDVVTGQLSDNDVHKSVVYMQSNYKGGDYNTLGGAQGHLERGSHACIKLVVQLYYRESTYNAPYSLQAEYVDEDFVFDRDYYGYVFQYNDIDNPDGKTLYDRVPDKPLKVQKIDVQILPGEEVLTQWMDLLKYAIRNIKVLYPYGALRNPQLMLTDYPTSTWTAKSANLVFHTAYHVVQFELSEPPMPPAKTYPNIQNISFET